MSPGYSHKYFAHVYVLKSLWLILFVCLLYFHHLNISYRYCRLGAHWYGGWSSRRGGKLGSRSFNTVSFHLKLVIIEYAYICGAILVLRYLFSVIDVFSTCV